MLVIARAVPKHDPAACCAACFSESPVSLGMQGTCYKTSCIVFRDFVASDKLTNFANPKTQML